MESIEEWRALPGYESFYMVSDRGRVLALEREWPADSIGRSLRRPEREMTYYDRSTYLAVDIYDENKHRKREYVHVLVLLTFVGPRPEGMVTRHLDGNPLNNHIRNLQWGTPSENMYDKIRHGTHSQVNKTHCPQGHPYSEENTYRKRVGSENQWSARVCKICHNKGVQARSAQRLECPICGTMLTRGSLPKHNSKFHFTGEFAE